MKIPVKILLILSLAVSAFSYPDYCNNRISDNTEQNCCAGENEDNNSDENDCSPLCDCNSVFLNYDKELTASLDVFHTHVQPNTDNFILSKTSSIFHPPKV